jgi:hypothetical protein
VPQDYVQAHLWVNLAASRLPSGEAAQTGNSRETFRLSSAEQRAGAAARVASEPRPTASAAGMPQARCQEMRSRRAALTCRLHFLPQRPSPRSETAKASAKANRPHRQPNRQRKLSYNEQRELDALLQRLKALEAEQASLSADTADPMLYRQDGRKIVELEEQMAEVESALEAAYARWEAPRALVRQPARAPPGGLTHAPPLSRTASPHAGVAAIERRE